jgi:hypothetical protein
MVEFTPPPTLKGKTQLGIIPPQPPNSLIFISNLSLLGSNPSHSLCFGFIITQIIPDAVLFATSVNPCLVAFLAH